LAGWLWLTRGLAPGWCLGGSAQAMLAPMRHFILVKRFTKEDADAG
jgi:hypothetical protein